MGNLKMLAEHNDGNNSEAKFQKKSKATLPVDPGWGFKTASVIFYQSMVIAAKNNRIPICSLADAINRTVFRKCIYGLQRQEVNPNATFLKKNL
jgi:hypothetical protein